ncbi:SDR family NAD(P)-dependent oxidoreductase [Marinobacterium sp. YM272]|uniref:SDR family NAD(P)-dependent oxidoreductase n=1 Tax=Marinobacterium sp. YM272 TaxID=3421654 RepID=UPI003D7F3C68
MSQQVALITGGASGIGLAAAKALAHAGFHVVIADIQTAAAEAAVGQLRSEQLSASAVTLDVSNEDAWRAAIDSVEKDLGRLDVLVNNAGLGEGGTLASTTLKAFNRVMAVNVNGVFLGCKYGIPLMERSGGGSVINVSSIFGIVSDQLTLAYSASKGAVRTLTKSLALDCADRGNGVRVNSIHPGFIETPMVMNAAAATPAEVIDPYVARTVGQTPMGRFGQPDELGDVIAFLASDASRFMTGSEVTVDGGFTAR